ncbi:MAG TPA: outer membrane protein assembly factor BamD [Bosea sp. (in: a-proteobacteria)]|jgi:outer membrane protein assembly factor BamD|uniref:outer membrane protein assembly factor BamD n=1 Tax=Bosea sp. (in: a-proteobacteria) TaxID=1871050 RepID=UPI002E11E14C|nr:outer membrane protein assembly factor BamD [Bosea sp. (in: a-proteobacteria)]
MRLKTFNTGEMASGGRRLALVFSLAAALGGCDTLSSMNPFDKPEVYKPEVLPTVPADKLYNEGLARMQNGDSEGATKKFEEIDKQAPFSPYSRKGLILTAYTNYQASKWDDAITASKRFLAQNPASPDAAYAQYIMAMSYFNQIPDATRDQERTEQALRAMQELLDRYPRSEYVVDVREKMLVARDQLAGKEMNVGRFYLEKRNYPGAVNRFRDVITKYQTTRHVEEALMRLTEAYMALGITNEAQTAAAVLGHNFPDSPWYKDAYVLLESGGLQPREDRGSYISRLFNGFSRTVTGLIR